MSILTKISQQLETPSIRIGSWVDFGDVGAAALVAAGCVIGKNASVQASAKICVPVHLSPGVQIKNDTKIDKFSFLNWDTIVYPNVHIGSYCSIGRNVHLGLAVHPNDWLSTHTFQYNSDWFPQVETYRKITRKKRHLHHAPTIIGSDVWIGNGALVRSGIRIGHGAIIGAGSVVTKNVPPYSIVGGVPAKLIRSRFPPDIVAELLETQWWKLNPEKLDGIDFSNIRSALTHLQKMKRAKSP